MNDREIQRAIEDQALDEPGWAVAYALLKLAAAQDRTAEQIKKLGLADASTPFGAVEAFIVAFEKQMGELAEAQSEIAGALNGIRRVISPSAPERS